MRRALAVTALTVLTVGLVPTGATGAVVHRHLRRDLVAIADAARRATNAPGAIVAVQRGRDAPTIVVRGQRSRRDATAIRPDDPFEVASVSKAFTAATALALGHHGRLDLNAPVVRYLIHWRFDRRIRVRQLLNHTSGLPSWGNKDDTNAAFSNLVQADFARRFTMNQSFAAAAHQPAVRPPGIGTHYSNLNTIALGRIIERVTGAPLAVAYHRYVLGPLHLRATGYPPEEHLRRAPIPGVLWADDARTVEVDTSQYAQDSLLTLGGPAAGMVSNAPDLLRFADAFLRGNFPTRALARHARKIGPGGAGLGILGFARHRYCIFDGCPPGSRFIRCGFAGNTNGAGVRVVRDPRLDVTVLVFTNSSERGRLDPFASKLLALVARH